MLEGFGFFLWDAVSVHAKPSAWQNEAWQGAAGRGKPARWQTHPVNGEWVSEFGCLLCFTFCTAAEPSKSQTRKPKCGKGTHCSRNAYMLVYRLQTREKSLTVEVPGKRALALLASPSRFVMLQAGFHSQPLLRPPSGSPHGAVRRLGVATSKTFGLS